MFIDFLLNTFIENKNKEAFIWQDKSYDFNWFLLQYESWSQVINKYIKPKEIIAIESETSPWALSLLLALIENSNIIVPISPSMNSQKEKYYKLAKCQKSISITKLGKYELKKYRNTPDYELYDILNENDKPGLVLFSSGTSGKIKAAVHDFTKLLSKYKKRRKDLRTLVFMLFDHIGGIDTLFYSLSNASTLITAKSRNPEDVCKAIEKYKVEVLPVTPTFLNLLLLSESYKNFDLCSLKYITYGTEPMPENTLKRINDIFPNVTILQKYGTTEVGTLRSKSLDSNSTWVKIGGEGFQTRIVNGILQIKAQSAMLGYLNAPSPFTEDGWFNTGDSALEKNGYILIKGRESEIINVGGEKVYPSEVENVIQELPFVEDVVVYGEKNAIMGNIVCADIALQPNEKNKKSRVKEIKAHCKEELENFKIPIKINAVEKKLYSERLKKKRKNIENDN